MDQLKLCEDFFSKFVCSTSFFDKVWTKVLITGLSRQYVKVIILLDTYKYIGNRLFRGIEAQTLESINAQKSKLKFLAFKVQYFRKLL